MTIKPAMQPQRLLDEPKKTERTKFLLFKMFVKEAVVMFFSLFVQSFKCSSHYVIKSYTKDSSSLLKNRNVLPVTSFQILMMSEYQILLMTAPFNAVLNILKRLLTNIGKQFSTFCLCLVHLLPFAT